jgi:hypothetical protein
VKTRKRTLIYRATHREPRILGTPVQPTTLDTAAGDSPMNVRAGVDEHYGEAIHWLRQQGKEEEALRILKPQNDTQMLLAVESI